MSFDVQDCFVTNFYICQINLIQYKGLLNESYHNNIFYLKYCVNLHYLKFTLHKYSRFFCNV